ncbi:MAG: hypothetical protein HOA60_13805 [Rhodospirillales bacterium]|jgi:hypothetical protein|nr:hypothetical protein [Rhodospirillales bacterium]
MQTTRDAKIKTPSADEALTALTRLLARQAARAWAMSCDAPSETDTPKALPPDKKELRNDEQR